MNLKLANKNHLVIKNQALSNLILQPINIISRTDTCQSETKVYILFCQSAILLQRWLSKNRDSCVEVFCKNVFLNVLQNSLEKTCAVVSFSKKL